MPLVRGDVSLGTDGLRALRSGPPPLLPLPSSPPLSSSSSWSLGSGSGSPPILLGGGGGGWKFPPRSTSFPLFCLGVEADRFSGLGLSGGIQGSNCPWFDGPGSPSPASVGGMVKLGFRDDLFCVSKLVWHFGISDFVCPEVLSLLDGPFDADLLH